MPQLLRYMDKSIRFTLHAKDKLKRLRRVGVIEEKVFRDN
jgi:hypothetical protein